MDFLTGTELLNKAYEKEADDKLYFRWIAKYDYLSFDDFKIQLGSNKTKDNKSEEEILEDVSEILKTFKWGEE